MRGDGRSDIQGSHRQVAVPDLAAPLPSRGRTAAGISRLSAASRLDFRPLWGGEPSRGPSPTCCRGRPRCTDPPPRCASRTASEWADPQLRRGRRDRARSLSLGLIDLGVAKGDKVSILANTRARVDLRRLRRALGRRDGRPDLPDQLPRGVPVRARELRRQGRHRRGRGTDGEDPQGPRPAAAARARDPDDRHQRRRDLLRRPRRPRRRAATPPSGRRAGSRSRPRTSAPSSTPRARPARRRAA